MIEKKRYTYLNSLRSSFTGSFFCNDIPLTNQEVLELLKENEQLKQKVNFYKYFQKDARELEKENEQLNEDVLRRKENEKILIKTANDLNELVDKLEKENERLKKENYQLSVRHHDCEKSLYNGIKYLKKLNEKFEKIFGISLENFLDIEYKR